MKNKKIDDGYEKTDVNTDSVAAIGPVTGEADAGNQTVSFNTENRLDGEPVTDVKPQIINGMRVIRLRDGVNVKVPPEEKRGLVIASKILIMIVASALSAIAQYSFVAPNNFARGGIAGIALILNHIYPQLYLGLFNILVNIPLLAVSWIFLSRRFCIATTGYIGISSVAMIVMEAIDARVGGVLRYVEAGTPILSAVFGGAIIGVSFAMMTRIGGSLGGTDIIAAIIQKKRPDVGVSWFVFLMDSTVVLASYFVYGMTAVLLALVLTFMISTVGDQVYSGRQSGDKSGNSNSPRRRNLRRNLRENRQRGYGYRRRGYVYRQTRKSSRVRNKEKRNRRSSAHNQALSGLVQLRYARKRSVRQNEPIIGLSSQKRYTVYAF